MTDDPNAMKAYMDNVERNFDKYNSEGRAYGISISYGIGSYGNEGVDAFLKELDEGMYEMKQEHHNAARV